MKKFWNNNHRSSDCSSYNVGLPLRSWLRICSGIGMVSAILYIISGTSLITHISQHEKATFSAMGITYSDKTRHIYYKRNAGFFIGIAVVLILINFVQLASDAMLFHSTLKISTRRSLWIFFLLDVILWVLTLVCFVTIFSGGGLFLLLVFLLGTAIRAYIVFILHEYITEESKIHNKSVQAQLQPQVSTIECSQPNSVKPDEISTESLDISNNVIMEVPEIVNANDNGSLNHVNSTDSLKQPLPSNASNV